MDQLIVPPHTIKSKIAAFDLDYTLICPKSGRRFPKDQNDWKLMFSNISNKLKKLNGYSIVVFTNQKNIENRMGLAQFREKCKDIQKEINIPMVFYISLKGGYFRKPFPGLFQYHQKHHPIAIQDSFYVGDAWCKNKCFSDSDLCFARNCGLTFYKAKEFFNTKKHVSYDFIPLSLFPKDDPQYVANQIKFNRFIKDKQYLFLIGGPATGKTSFCKKHLTDYVRLSKDDYKTVAKYRNVIQKNLEKKIVFDNTNYTNKSRQLLLSYLKRKEIGYIIRNIPKPQSFYMNQYRHFITRGKVSLLPMVAIHTYYKRLELPVGENVFIMNKPWIFSDDFKAFYC